MLSVAALATVTFPSFLFEDKYFLGLTLADNFAGNSRVSDQWSADFHLAVAADKQDVRKDDLLADFADKLLNPDHIPFRNAVLFTASSDHSVFHSRSSRNVIFKGKPDQSQLASLLTHDSVKVTFT